MILKNKPIYTLILHTHVHVPAEDLGGLEVGHGHVNRARMQLSRRGLHAGALTSSGHYLVLLSCDLRVLQNFAGS